MSFHSMMAADYLNKLDRWKAYELHGDRVLQSQDIPARFKAEKLAMHLILMGMGLNRIGENLLRAKQ